MDNRIFNINGAGLDKLKATLNLFLFESKERGSSMTFEGYTIDVDKGFVLMTYGVEASKGHIKFPTPLNVDVVSEIVYTWVMSNEALKTTLTCWDCNSKHDGDNDLGWRAYVEDWGHIKTRNSTINWECIAIKPAYLWYGK